MSGIELVAGRVTTLAERKRSEAARRKSSADGIVRELEGYAKSRDGRFVVFGSYVDDAMRFDSDLDILLDFPENGATDAWLFAEDLGARHAVPLDLHDARTTKPAFLARVLERGRVLP